ncbi:hypothetical protein HHK36_029571 [Tetracentron sinense]|uniref:UspA domain-containing protein n=1 Tax=Tetracentron sinense TaxID=13715 RepID=A0A835CZG3_TETSI|nr:hypothetical protein HHK36_029571 [Tetracentron sinense]
MEEEISGSSEQPQYRKFQAMSPEIVEIEENSINSVTSNIDEGTKDVYVCVGKDDLDVLKWALDHVVLPGARVFLVHVFPPINYIPTPVGRLSKSQVSKEQVNTYIREENTRRRTLLYKYIRLCTDVKVVVDTMLIESDLTAKAILDLIPVLNITTLVMGSKRSSTSRRSKKGLGKSEFVRKNAPNFCEVTIVFNDRRVMGIQQVPGLEPSSPASSDRRPITTRHPEKNFFEWVCFTGKFS